MNNGMKTNHTMKTKQTKPSKYTHAIYFCADGSQKRVDFIPTRPRAKRK